MIFTWNLNPVAFHIPFVEHPVRWYGLMYVIAFFIFLAWSWYNIRYIKTYKKAKTKTTGLRFIKNYQEWESIALTLFIIGIIGGRLGHFLFFNPAPLFEDWTEIFRMWNGGMAIQGGFLLATLGAIYICWKRQIYFWFMADIVAAPLAFAFGIGRIGNIMNGELAGKVTSGNWGVIYPHIDNLPRHIPPLYELIGYMLIVMILVALFVRWKHRPTGILFPLFMILASIARFYIEYYKVSPLDVAILTSGQVLCLVIMIAGLLMSWWLWKDPARIKLDTEN